MDSLTSSKAYLDEVNSPPSISKTRKIQRRDKVGAQCYASLCKESVKL